jgi:hypothetical protein
MHNFEQIPLTGPLCTEMRWMSCSVRHPTDTACSSIRVARRRSGRSGGAPRPTLSCSVFVTDATHRSTLERQLADTEQLIARTTAAFQQRHGRPMPEDNVWLVQRRAEHAALTHLLAAMDAVPGQAVHKSGFSYAACEYSLISPLRIFLRRMRTVLRSVTGGGDVSRPGGS